jgi:hypothetical protein
MKFKHTSSLCVLVAVIPGTSRYRNCPRGLGQLKLGIEKFHFLFLNLEQEDMSTANVANRLDNMARPLLPLTFWLLIDSL